jgi:hypothetical protein
MPDDPNNQPAPEAESPGALFLRGPDDDDSKWTTEKLGKMHPWIHRLLALWLIALGVVAIYLLIGFWPTSSSIEEVKQKADSLSTQIDALSKVLTASPPDSAVKHAKSIVDLARSQSTRGSIGEGEDQSRDYFLIALLSGILGGAIHGLSSLMDFRGQRRLFRSWTMWYFGLPILGGFLSLVFFFLLRAGLFPAASSINVVSPFGIAAIGAICGLFTDKATVKLSEVLDILFSSQSKTREGKLGGGGNTSDADESGKTPPDGDG